MGSLISTVNLALRLFFWIFLEEARFTLVIMVFVIIFDVVAIIFFTWSFSNCAHQRVLLRCVFLCEDVVSVFEKNNLRHCGGFLDLKCVDPENITQDQEPLV